MWSDDEIRLHALHELIQILQNIARICGTWALELEKSYDSLVESLH